MLAWGDRSCTELQQVSDVICLFCGVSILGGAGDTSSFARQSLHVKIASARGEERREVEGQEIFCRLRKANFHAFAHRTFEMFVEIAHFRKQHVKLQHHSSDETANIFPQDPNITPSKTCNIPQVASYPGDRRPPKEGDKANAS